LRRIFNQSAPKENQFGIEKRRIVSYNLEDLGFYKDGKQALFLCLYPKKAHDFYLKECGELHLFNQTLAAAWDEDSFGVKVKGEKDLKHLEDLYSQFSTKNIAIWLGGGHIFQNSGLILGIINRIPQRLTREMYKADQEVWELKQAAEKTGIRQKIDEANAAWWDKNPHSHEAGPYAYFALKPSWDSKHHVIFWLNPMNQDKNNSGWFTVEQLELWLQNKGPVIKK
jgi:hypothetical protein